MWMVGCETTGRSLWPSALELSPGLALEDEGEPGVHRHLGSCSGTSHFLICPRYVSVPPSWRDHHASQSFGLLSNHGGPGLLSPLALCLTWFDFRNDWNIIMVKGSRLVLLTWRHSASQRWVLGGGADAAHEAMFWLQPRTQSDYFCWGALSELEWLQGAFFINAETFHIPLQLTHCNRLSV